MGEVVDDTENISPRNPLRNVYAILNVSDAEEMHTAYTREDQRLMTSGEWDYNDPTLLINQVKEMLEATNPGLLTEHERTWREHTLWFWYHHAVSCAVERYKDRDTAKRYALKALEYHGADNPNRVTRLLYLLVDDDVASAERWVAEMAGNPDERTAIELLDEYKKRAGMFAGFKWITAP